MPNLFYRNLPHWRPPNANYFVTFRRFGNLPGEVVAELQREQESKLRHLAKCYQGAELYEVCYKLWKRCLRVTITNLTGAKGFAGWQSHALQR